MDNCVLVGEILQGITHFGSGDEGEEIELTRNTLVSTTGPVHVYLAKAPVKSPTRIQATANVFDAPSGLILYQSEDFHKALGKVPSPDELKSLARQLVTWRDRDNLYRTGGCCVQWGAYKVFDFPPRQKSPAEWNRFWNTPDGNSREGQFRYQGGNLLSRLATAPDKITPEDFRLRPDSAGYRAGKDGKDLGADVDLVGPGAAYERWKKTPEYQQWLKETGQKK